MTREEAEAKAKSMPRIRALVDFRNKVVDREWKGLDIIFPDGNKAGIGNPKAIDTAKKALLHELDQQILAESGGDIVEVITYGKSEKMKREDALAKFIEYMAGSEGSERDRYTNVYLDLIAGKSICKDEH